MNTKQKNTLVAKITKHKDAVAKHRDELRKILYDLQDLDENLTGGGGQFRGGG